MKISTNTSRAVRGTASATNTAAEDASAGQTAAVKPPARNPYPAGGVPPSEVGTKKKFSDSSSGAGGAGASSGAGGGARAGGAGEKKSLGFLMKGLDKEKSFLANAKWNAVLKGSGIRKVWPRDSWPSLHAITAA